MAVWADGTSASKKSEEAVQFEAARRLLNDLGYDVVERFPPKGWTACEGPLGLESYTREDSMGISLDRVLDGGSITLAIPHATCSAPNYREAKSNLQFILQRMLATVEGWEP